MKNTLVGVDLAKAVFQLAISHWPGKVDSEPRLTRDKFLAFFAQLPKATVVMEACGSSHYWARRLQELGHQVVLLPPHQVRPYVRRNKTDRADAKALLEAYRNADIRSVPVKTVAQQILTTLHRLRAGWMGERTARINSLRGHLRELGVFIPVGPRHVLPRVFEVLADADSPVPDVLRPFLAEICEEIRVLDKRIKGTENQLELLARQLPAVKRLRTIPGIGLLIATAFVALVGDIHRFPSARHLSSYLGLTPREFSSALKRRLGRISKRGDVYLRMLLIHGARSVLFHAKRMERPDRLRTWALRLEKKIGCRATVKLTPLRHQN